MKTIQDLFRIGMDREIPMVCEEPESEGIRLNLGCGNKKIPNTIGLELPEWDADFMAIPALDNSVVVIHAYHFLEHVQDPITVLAECQRVLKPGGLMNIVVPYYNSKLMAKDLTHRHAFCEDTWRITFNNSYYRPPGSPEEGWKFVVGLNLIIGIAEKNLCLMTQLHRTE